MIERGLGPIIEIMKGRKISNLTKDKQIVPSKRYLILSRIIAEEESRRIDNERDDNLV